MGQGEVVPTFTTRRTEGYVEGILVSSTLYRSVLPRSYYPNLVSRPPKTPRGKDVEVRLTSPVCSYECDESRRISFDDRD